MSSNPPTLKVASQTSPLSLSTPHLMPFHIAYSGPAPISTYFRIKPTSEPTYGRDERQRPPPTPLPPSETDDSTDSQATIIAGSYTSASSSSVATLAESSTLMDVEDDENVDATQDNTTTLSYPLSSHHFAASFRGRTIHGVEVDLPEGYAGIVLRVPSDDAKGKSAASAQQAREEEKKSKTKGRTTRRSKRAPEPEVVEMEDEEHGGGDGSAPLEEGVARFLQPVSTFSSFVLWHPDIPVDEARDEYLRSLTEWTRIAAEIHRMEDC